VAMEQKKHGYASNTEFKNNTTVLNLLPNPGTYKTPWQSELPKHPIQYASHTGP
jgi:hypothetical protein